MFSKKFNNRDFLGVTILDIFSKLFNNINKRISNVTFNTILIPNTAVFGPTKLIETIASIASTTIASTARMKILAEDLEDSRNF